MAMAKKCDRCGKLYEHYPKGNKSQSNAIRKIQRDAFGGIANTIQNSVIDLCQECMDEFEKFMKNHPLESRGKHFKTKGGSSDEK